MAQKRKTHAEEFKARVAVEAIKGVRTLSELSAAHGVHRRSLPIGSGNCWTGRRRCLAGAGGHGPERGGGDGAAVRGDRPSEDGTGVAQKKL